MKILVYGCGVIGSYLVHKLCEAGNDVTVVSRGAWKQILQEKGLRIHHKFSGMNTVDHPRVVGAAPADERFDLVFSVMQGQQQRALLPVLANANTGLVVLVGNNPDAAEMEKELLALSNNGKTVLFAFQGTAGLREANRVTCVGFGSGSMTVGGVHREPSLAERQKLLSAFAGTDYDLEWTDDMEGWLFAHAAFILPVVYLCYALKCDLRSASPGRIADVLSAAREAYGLLQLSGIKIRPEEDELSFESGPKMAALRLILYGIAKTSLGKLCASDHCRNAVTEMEWLDSKFVCLQKKHPEHQMPVWDKLRGSMPSWSELHQTYDKSSGELPMPKPDYANWMPKEMVYGSALGSAGLLTGGLALCKRSEKSDSAFGKLTGGLMLAGAVGAGAFSVYSYLARKAFSYDGSRMLSRQIIEGVAEYAILPEGGLGLDVGCGSGALTIACAKRYPKAKMLGIDHWGPEYKDFSQQVCEMNAEAEGVSNVLFEKGDAVKLDFADESFDLVTSNYVYHNIPGVSKQGLLRESLRVLKKGGIFAIHDLMEPARYGDMQKFVDELKAEGFEEVFLIDTTKLFFTSPSEAKLLMLGGSRLLFGRK